MWKLVIILVVSFYFFVLTKTALAQVLINEVYPQPDNGQFEWVEIKNLATQSADLSGWYIEDLLSTPKIIFTFGSTDLLSGQFYTATFSGQLNNGADGVILKNPTGQIISQMKYDSSDQGFSWSHDGLESYVLSEPTQGAENVSSSPSPSVVPQTSPQPSFSPTPTPASQVSASSILAAQKIHLATVAPCPKSGSEWLEWVNNGEERVMATVVIKDLQANSIPLSLEMDVGQKLVTNLTRHIFNNSGDELFVYFDDQLLIHKNLPSCEEAGTLFSYEQDVSWPTVETSSSSDSSVNVASQLTSEKTSMNSPDQNIIAKPLMSPNYRLPIVTRDEKASSSAIIPTHLGGEVLGSISNHESIFNVSPWFLICGGFLWIGVGIMEIYGFAITQNKIME